MVYFFIEYSDYFFLYSNLLPYLSNYIHTGLAIGILTKLQKLFRDIKNYTKQHLIS